MGGNTAPKTVVRTACGREMRVGRIRMNGLRPSAERITLDVGCEAYDRGDVWASLTPDEARRIAQALLREAEAAERETAGSG